MGRTRAYGYNAAHDKTIAKEAAIIKEAPSASWRDSLRSVCVDFNEREYQPSKGHLVSTVLRGILTAYSTSGQRAYHDENPVRAELPPSLRPVKRPLAIFALES